MIERECFGVLSAVWIARLVHSHLIADFRTGQTNSIDYERFVELVLRYLVDMPSRTMDDATTPAAKKGNKMERSSSRTRISNRHEGDSYVDLEDDEKEDHTNLSLAVQTPPPPILTTPLLPPSFPSTIIALFGPSHASLTSRAFWLTQIALELDFVLWRPGFLGREPEDAEVEGIAEECLGEMWGLICQEVNGARGEWWGKRREEDGKAGGDGWGRRRKRERRAARLGRNVRGMEEYFGGMDIGEEIGEGRRQNEYDEYEDVGEEMPRRDGAEKEKKRERYSGCGVSYISVRMDGVDGREEMQVKSRTGPGGAGCLLKKSLG